MNLTTHFSPRGPPRSAQGRPRTAVSLRSTIRQVTPSPERERERERERELGGRGGANGVEKEAGKESAKTGVVRGIAVSVATQAMGTGGGKGKGVYRQYLLHFATLRRVVARDGKAN